MTRVVTIMGSGETSPTMVRTHKEVLASLGESPTAVMLDTPFGFQSNADELTARAQEYFRTSVGQRLEVAGFRVAGGAGAEYEQAMERLRQADYVFAGPGSPSYALRQWRRSAVPQILLDKLRDRGAVTFASAAALTLGAVTVPVYEIYKVGEEPRWLEGLDLLGDLLGLSAAVIPHFNNAEGGTHDTRFCYLGEERLRTLEAQLPEGAIVIGVDEHTGLKIDFEAGVASVVGIGTVTIRRGGKSIEHPAGSDIPLDSLGATTTAGPAPGPAAEGTATAEPGATPSLLATAQNGEARFDAALGRGDVDAALDALLETEASIAEWRSDSLQSDEMDRARSLLRAMVVRLGECARTGTRNESDIVGPYVDALVQLRDTARSDKRWADADAIRDQLAALGVEVRDAEAGSTWDLHS